MKTELYILSFVLLLLTVACTTVEQDLPSSKADMTFVAEWADMQTKTAFQADETSIWWSPYDEICIYYGASEGNKFTSTNDAEVPKAEFRGTLNAFTGESEAGVAYYFWAVYPYESAVSCDGESVVATLADEQMAKAGSFAPNTNIAIAKSTGLNLSFYNACSWFRFSVTKEGVKRVIFRGNNDEDVTGKFRVSMGEDNRPTAPEVIEGKKEITLHLPDYEPFEVGKIYYITLFPQVFTKGFTVTFKTDTEIATRSISAKATFLRSKYNSGIGFDSPEKGVVYTEDPNAENLSGGVEGGTESGLYFGLSTFDRYYQYYPIKLISEDALEDYYSIINSLELTTLNGTLLLYSCDEDITAMRRVSLPSDLTTVSLVTFTDGFDQGSRNYHRDLYSNDNEYLDAVNYRLLNETIGDVPIKSYAIGLKGTDALSDIDAFRDWLRKLASTPKNSSEKYVYEIDWDNFNILSDAFAKIAEELSESIKLYNVRVHFPLVGDGDRVRITFDINDPKNTNARKSNWYIEGIYDDTNLLLHDIEYHGFDGNLPTTIHDSGYDGFELYFNFDGLHPSSDAEIVETNIYTWRYNTSTSTWTANTETSQDAPPEINVIHSSALVLLNLDLSKSLEGKLPDLKKYSKEFISTLYTSSVDPNVVKTVRLNKTEMSLLAGKTEALVATVSPSTANIASLKWESAIPSVATVDQNGNVYGVSEGTTIVTVKSEDGKAKASCTIRVSFQHVESISLNKSELTMYEGKTETLFATIMPIDASDASVSWTSSAPDVATVSSSGVVKVLSKGSATITAKTTDGEKTATCNVVVTDYTPSTNPIDLSLVVYSPTLRRRGYITNEELQYVNMSEYTVEGLAVLSASGDFMIALEDASSSTICYDAASLFYQIPSYDQGMTISARFQEINNALSEFGGSSLRSDSYYWTSGKSSDGYPLCIFGSGGKLLSTTRSTSYVREVAPLTSLAPRCFVTKSQGLSLAYYDANGKRCVAKKRDDVPLGCTIEGLAVESSSGKGNVIIALEDANSTPITWEAARNVYNMENMITEEEGRLISARFQEINNALSEFGGSRLQDNYYWTSGKSSTDNYYYCINGGGGSLYSRYYANTAYLRLKKGTVTTSNPVFAITLATPTDYLNNRTSSVAFTAFKVDAATIDFTMDNSTAPAFNVEILKSDDGLLTTIPAGTTGYTYAEGTDKWGITGTGGIDAVKLRGIPTLPLWNYVDDKTYYGTLTIKNSLGYTVATMKVAFTKTLPTAAPSGYSVKTGLLNASGVYNCYMVPNNWTANAATNGTMAMLNVFNFPAGLASNYIISFAESNKNASGAFIPVTVAGNGPLSVDKSYIDNTKQHATSVVYNYGDISSVRHADASIADKNVYVGVDSFPTVYNCIYNSTYTWAWKWSVGKNASGAVTSSDYPGWSGATPVPGFFQTVAPTTTMTPEIFYNDFDGQTMPIANIQGYSHWDSAYNAPLNSPLKGSLAIQSAKLTSNANGVEEYYTVDTGLKFTMVSGATNPTVDVPSTLTITCKDMYGHDVNVKMPVIVKRR